MTPQEKDLLTTLLARLKSTAGQPKDPEADALIRQALAEQPDMPYYLMQTVLIQDLSLHQAQQRISDLEKQLADAQQAAKPSVGSFLGGLFGHQPPAPPTSGPPPAGPWTRSPQVAAAPPAQPYGQPGYAQPGYGQPMGGAGGMTPGLGESVVNNYYGSDAAGGAGGGDWSSDPGGAGGGGDWSSDAGVAGGGGDYSDDDPGNQDFSSDQDWGGGDWSSDNTSC